MLGKIIPWRVKVGDSEQHHPIRPAFCTNDEQLELHAVLAGEVIAQIAVPTAIALIRNERLVPLLVEHMTDSYQMFIYYGSRQAQPTRVRRFIDLAVERLVNSSDFMLSRAELAALSAGLNQGYSASL